VAEYDEKLLSSSGSGLSGGYGSSGGFSDNSDEPLIEDAINVIRDSGKASASLLQRRLKLGYALAARILDLLEEKGIIGPSDGAKPREVFLDQLGGVGAVEFSAREHNLTGELRPIEEDEPTFTSFARNIEEEEADEPSKNIESEEEIKNEVFPNDFLAATEDDPEDNLEPVVINEDIVAVVEEDEPIFEGHDLDELADKAEIEDVIEEAIEEEEEAPQPRNKSEKKLFDEDEWT
jgi:hypothetical protein